MLFLRVDVTALGETATKRCRPGRMARLALRRLSGNTAVTMDALDALGSPLRRDILVALRKGPLSVGALAHRFPVSRPAISRHLKVLESAGLVAQSERGTTNLYSVRVEGFRSVQTFLDSFWDVALDRLEALARASAKQEGRRRS